MKRAQLPPMIYAALKNGDLEKAAAYGREKYGMTDLTAALGHDLLKRRLLDHVATISPSVTRANKNEVARKQALEKPSASAPAEDAAASLAPETKAPDGEGPRMPLDAPGAGLLPRTDPVRTLHPRAGIGTMPGDARSPSAWVDEQGNTLYPDSSPVLSLEELQKRSPNLSYNAGFEYETNPNNVFSAFYERRDVYFNPAGKAGSMNGPMVPKFRHPQNTKWFFNRRTGTFWIPSEILMTSKNMDIQPVFEMNLPAWAMRGT